MCQYLFWNQMNESIEHTLASMNKSKNETWMKHEWSHKHKLQKLVHSIMHNCILNTFSMVHVLCSSFLFMKQSLCNRKCFYYSSRLNPNWFTLSTFVCWLCPFSFFIRTGSVAPKIILYLNLWINPRMKHEWSMNRTWMNSQFKLFLRSWTIFVSFY